MQQGKNNRFIKLYYLCTHKQQNSHVFQTPNKHIASHVHSILGKHVACTNYRQ